MEETTGRLITHFDKQYLLQCTHQNGEQKQSFEMLNVTVTYTTLILPKSLIIQPRAKKVN